MREGSRTLKRARYRPIARNTTRLLIARAAALASFIALVGLTAPVEAHHSFAAVYDQTKPVRVEGVVERLDMRNPHAVLVVVPKDADGSEAAWTFEMGAPRVLTRLGWSSEKVKTGDRILVEGALSRSGGRQGAAQFVTTAAGERLQVVLPFR